LIVIYLNTSNINTSIDPGNDWDFIPNYVRIMEV